MKLVNHDCFKLEYMDKSKLLEAYTFLDNLGDSSLRMHIDKIKSLEKDYIETVVKPSLEKYFLELMAGIRLPYEVSGTFFPYGDGYLDITSYKDFDSTYENQYVTDTILNSFVFKSLRLIEKFSDLSEILPYMSFDDKKTNRSVTTKKYTLNNMFNECSLEEIKVRNSVVQRWFEDPFEIGDRIMYLSTQWCNDLTSLALQLENFEKLILMVYPKKYWFDKIDKNYILRYIGD